MITYVKRCFSATPNLPSSQTQLRSSLARAIKVFLLAGVLPTTTFAATIQGIAFEDINDNSIFDSGEPPLPYTAIFIRENKADAGEDDFFTTLTDEYGEYSSIAHEPGLLTIWSEIPAGWIQTMPIRGEGIAMFDVGISEPNQNLIVDFGFFNPYSTQPPPGNTTNPEPGGGEKNQPPQANFTLSPPEGQAPLTVTFDGNSSFDPEGQAIRYEWLLPDGFVFSTEPKTTFTFDEPGRYEIELVVTDNDGQIGDRTAIVTVREPEAPQKPPVAKSTIEPPRGLAPLTVELDGNNSFDPDGEIVGCEWLIETKPPVDDCEARITFDEPGEYEVTLVITDNHSLSDQMTKVVFVEEKPKNAPVANMSLNPISGQAPLIVSANGNDSSDPDGDIIDYQWTVSDSKKASGSQANFTFNSAGKYTISLVVTDNDGLSATAQQIINVSTVKNSPPTAAFVATPTEGDAPLTVTLNGRDSFDSDGKVVHYKWTASNGQNASGASATTTFTFDKPGTYTISLVVKDDKGDISSTANQTITVEELKVIQPSKVLQPPIALLEISPKKGEAPLTVNLDGSLSIDPDGRIASYEWKASDGQEASGKFAEMTFDIPGRYRITLEVKDNEDLVSTKVWEIVTVTESGTGTPPVAKFEDIPTSGQAPFALELDASSSFDPDGGEIVYEWTVLCGKTSLKSTGITTSFTLEKAGNCTVVLTVTDDEGLTNSTSQTILITKEKVEAVPVSFASLNESYAVGDKVIVDLIEQVKTNRFNRVDLWVAIQIPSGELLFRTPLPLVPFSPQPQPFKESLESSDSTTRLLDFEVIPGIGGTYTFYAVYLKEGSDPLKEGLEATQRSNLAIQLTTLE
jgi:PKD repeat protein